MSWHEWHQITSINELSNFTNSKKNKIGVESPHKTNFIFIVFLFFIFYFIEICLLHTSCVSSVFKNRQIHAMDRFIYSVKHAHRANLKIRKWKTRYLLYKYMSCIFICVACMYWLRTQHAHTHQSFTCSHKTNSISIFHSIQSSSRNKINKMLYTLQCVLCASMFA